MLKKLLFLCVLLFSYAGAYAGDVLKYCYQTQSETPPTFLWSNDTGSQGASSMLAKELNQQSISVSGHWSIPAYDALFVTHTLKLNECVLLNSAEKMSLSRQQINKDDVDNHDSESMFPVVHFDLDGRRRFGLILESTLDELIQVEYQRSVLISDIMGYSNNRQLTLIYVICPKDRMDVCKLAIKDRGAWVNDALGNPFMMDVLAKSNWKDFGYDQTVRIQKNGDTPQGIYRVYASIDWKNRESFGNMRRIDLDAQYPALNGHTGYQDNKFLLNAILPASVYNDYWFNEWPLAHSLGRNNLRVHANGPYDADKCIVTPHTQKTYRPTAGCINTGDMQTTQVFFDKLIELNVFTPEHLHVDQESQAYLWDPAQRYGEVFLIVVDED